MKNLMKNYPGIWLLLSLTLIFYFFNLYNNGLAFPDGTDGIFHLERIISIRSAFLEFKLPNWVNFTSFDFSGRAVNAMYPDFTLWILSAITIFLPTMLQYLTIEIILVWITYFSCYLVFKRKTSVFNASLLSFIYTTSTVAGNITNNFEPGSIIFYAILPAFLINLNSILKSKRFNFKISIYISIMVTLVAWSHLWSTIILLFLGIIYLITYILLGNSLTKAILTNVLFILINVLISTLPILYRMYIISHTALLSLGNFKHVESINVSDLLTNWSWNGYFSNSTILIVFIPLIFIVLKKTITDSLSNFEYSTNLLFLLISFFTVILISTDLFPWKLMDNFPILNSMQMTNYRLLPLLVPITFMIMIEISSKINNLTIILTLSAVIGFSAMLQIISNDILIGSSNPTLITKYTRSIKLHKKNRTGGTFINNDALYTDKLDIIRDYPDYVPKIIGNNPLNSWVISDFGKKISEHRGFLNSKVIKFDIEHKSTNGIKFEGLNKKGDILLPLFAYKNLDYKVKVGNQRISYTTENGVIEINYNKINKPIYVSYYPPKEYKIFVIISLTYFTIEIILTYIIKMTGKNNEYIKK